MFNGTMEEYVSDPINQIGNMAEPGTGNVSMVQFMLVMGLLGVMMTWVLNRRKEGILKEIYSKISIVDR